MAKTNAAKAGEITLPLPIDDQIVSLTLSDADVAKLKEAMAQSDPSRARRFDRDELEQRLGLLAKDTA